MDLEKIFNFKKLSGTVYTAGQPLRKEFDSIVHHGFDVVIFLAFLNGTTGVPDEKAYFQRAGMKFENIPVEWEDPRATDFEKFVRLMNKYENEKRFIHCEANMRVSVFMALYRITQKGWSHEQAMSDVYDIWRPNPTWTEFMTNILNRRE